MISALFAPPDFDGSMMDPDGAKKVKKTYGHSRRQRTTFKQEKLFTVCFRKKQPPTLKNRAFYYLLLEKAAIIILFYYLL